MARHVGLRHSGVTQAPDGEPQVTASLYHLGLCLF